MNRLRKLRTTELLKIAEVNDRNRFLQKTFQKTFGDEALRATKARLMDVDIASLKTTMKGSMLTYLLHCEARIASFLGQGFYTIGPCGEELLGALSMNMRPYDLTALHYRHLAPSIVRQLLHDNQKMTQEIALDRARGYTCSIYDPITAGRHCSIGGRNAFQTEFLVTSTLATQIPAAVGRAIAIPLSHHLLGSTTIPETGEKACQFHKQALSIVSLGDGSFHHAHTQTSLFLAQYISYSQQIKFPLVFIISDNDISISYKGNGFLRHYLGNLANIEQPDLYIQETNGASLPDLLSDSAKVFDYTRRTNKPSVLYVHSLPRRFGHAATDRQAAYYTAQQIQQQIDADPLSDSIAMLMELGIYGNPREIEEMFQGLQHEVETAFDQASLEPKQTKREELLQTTSAPLPPRRRASSAGDISKQQLLPSTITVRNLSLPLATTTNTSAVTAAINSNNSNNVTTVAVSSKAAIREVMRKHMTSFYHELLAKDPTILLLGEDIRHGGYYLVTDGLATLYPQRVLDFPPDETTLIGAAIGFSQAGFCPILEIPYAKYLDSGYDLFTETAIMYWLSNGQQKNGMLVRLQGFGQGIFGGNFHTNNSLGNLLSLPGIDVVCYSNGQDYVRGGRYLHRCAKAGRVVVSVDCTDLLNKRHVNIEKKDEWMLSTYPAQLSGSNSSSEKKGEGSEDYELDFDQIILYPDAAAIAQLTASQEELILISYGTGIPTCLLAREQLKQLYPQLTVTILDTPCLSQTPQGLVDYLTSSKPPATSKHKQYLLFADICKKNATMPSTMRIVDLQAQGLLQQQQREWRVVGAVNTYNPLGTYLTFLSVEDILNEVQSMIGNKQ